MTEKKINHIYFVDGGDNTKGTICAFEEHIDMRHKDCINTIAEKLGDIFSFIPYISLHKEDIARCIAHHNFANIHEYTFGVEEIDFLS